MRDHLGREIDYLRISITDRCNLRCVYCMPEEGIEQISHREILTFEEIEKICRVLAAEGLKKVKLTGGEPLVRKNCAGLAKMLKAIPGIEEVTLTTNGILLAEQLPALCEAGLDAVNISLDTLDPERFREITRRDRLSEVLRGIEAALQYPGLTVKINCVPILEDRENLIHMASLARDYPLHVRFIEVMPLGQEKNHAIWNEAAITAVLEEAYGPASPCELKLGNGPGHYLFFDGFKGRIGFISAISHKFCASCNRIRLTSDGFLKACLQYGIGADLKEVLRNGETEEELKRVIDQVLDKKPAGHHFLETDTMEDEVRIMAQIGG